MGRANPQTRGMILIEIKEFSGRFNETVNMLSGPE